MSASLQTTLYPLLHINKWSMSVFTSGVDRAKLYMTKIFRLLTQRAVSLKFWFIRERLSGRFRQHKIKIKVQLGNPKSGHGQYWSGRLRELFITKFTSQFKRGFTNVVVTRAGRLREWSQGELRLYNCTHKRLHIRVVQRRPNIRSHSVLFILCWPKFLRVGSFVLIAT